jgi:hypothetical protein
MTCPTIASLFASPVASGSFPRMAIPDFQSIMQPVLAMLADGQEHP